MRTHNIEIECIYSPVDRLLAFFGIRPLEDKDIALETLKMEKILSVQESCMTKEHLKTATFWGLRVLKMWRHQDRVIRNHFACYDELKTLEL